MKTDKYNDRIGRTTTISLYDYGLIRDPKTNKVIVCLNPQSDEHTKENPPKIKVTFIEFDDVKEVLQDIDNGYFDFIGSDRQTEIDTLHNNYLATTIMLVNQYNGSLLGYLYY